MDDTFSKHPFCDAFEASSRRLTVGHFTAVGFLKCKEKSYIHQQHQVDGSYRIYRTISRTSFFIGRLFLGLILQCDLCMFFIP